MKSLSGAPHVIVAGAGLNGLGVSRALRDAGARVTLLYTQADDVTARTRCAVSRLVPSLEGDLFLDALEATVKTLGTRPVLILTQEGTVRTVSNARERVAASCDFLMPDKETVAALTSKHGFEASALTHAAPIPRGVSLNGMESLAPAESLTYPVALKPDGRDDAYDTRFRKAYKVADFAELTKIYSEIAPVAPHMIVQEWIEGADSDIYFCLQARGAGDKVFASFCGRKLRSWPPRTGGTASCTVAEADLWPEIEALTNDYFARANVPGLCSMEYKRDSVSGRFVMIEPTIARSDYQEYVAHLHGVNVPAAYVAGVLGLEVPNMTPDYRPQIWRDRISDARSAQQNPVPLPVTGPAVDGLFELRDPMPAAYEFAGRLRKRLGL